MLYPELPNYLFLHNFISNKANTEFFFSILSEIHVK